METHPTSPLTVGILIFNEVEVLDFAGPFEVFSVAGRFKANGRDQDDTDVAMRAVTIAQTAALVHARGGLQIQPQFTFDNHPPLDVLVVPGGWGTRAEVRNPVLLDWLRRTVPNVGIKASVCTGSFLYGAIGLFDGLKATTHWGSLDRMAQTFPQVEIIRNVRWIDQGAVLSSAGISAGIDVSLHLVERLFGRELALQTAHQMEYDWQETEWTHT